MKHLKLFESWDYEKNKSLDALIKNARKWDEESFIEEYIYRNQVTLKMNTDLSKGSEVQLYLNDLDDNGNQIYKNGIKSFIPYVKVISTGEYTDEWKFIINNVPELTKKAIELYHINKNNTKPKFNGSKVIRAYHASSKKFEQFKYDEHDETGQIGNDVGFFFYLNIKNAEYYTSVLKENNGVGYLYTVDVQIGKQMELNGEDIGTNWGRRGELEQAEIEGYDTVIIRDADTGVGGITDELIVFDDDNIKIINIEKV